MSTPIKPPSGPSGAGGPAGPEADGVDGAAGSFGAVVEGARSGAASAASGAGALEGLSAELASGRLGADAAIERLVQRALAGASALPASERAALEAQLRGALAGDPTLLTLRKDLERATPSKA